MSLHYYAIGDVIQSAKIMTRLQYISVQQHSVSSQCNVHAIGAESYRLHVYVSGIYKAILT